MTTKENIESKMIILSYRILIKVLKMFKLREMNVSGEINGVLYKLNFKKILKEE